MAGIFIVRIILGHYMSLLHLNESLLYRSMNILFFFMPWFFFKSGMFCSEQRKDVKPFLMSNARKFLLPYVFFSIVGIVIAASVALINEGSLPSTLLGECKTLVLKQAIHFNAPLWFLLSLCFVRVFFNCIRNAINHYLLLGLSLLFAFLHYLFLAKHGLYWPGNLCSGLAFYILGTKLKNLQYNKKIVISSLIVLVTIGIFRPTIVTMYGNFLLYENGIYLLWYPFCLAGIIVFNNLIKHMGFILEHFHFNDIGHHSMIYYVLHWPIALLIIAIYQKISAAPNNWELLVYLCLSWLGLLPLMTYVFNTKAMARFIGK
ncbi:acyltransferase family protein [Fibrobacter sp. UWB3]|uniref:acyltransferase family protein n=1 Tax=Fibrobacter sp. UWB3 TaxID=1964357 RepID=UPI0020CCFE93|nr:acyltransferase family protein [Fibrobacter sp. UWB3]